MNCQFIYLSAFAGGYVLLIFLCEYLNRRLHIAAEYTRKSAHTISALSALFFPYVFTDPVYIFILCSTCCIILFITNRKRLLRSIDGVERRSGGSYLLALAIGVTYYISVTLKDNTLYVLPILILAIADPFAGIVGKRVSSKSVLNGKTIAGSLTFLSLSLLICIIYLTTSHCKHILELSVFAASAATVAELLSPRGTDNLTIPLTVTGVLFFL